MALEMWNVWRRERGTTMDSNNADIGREIPGKTAVTDESNRTIASVSHTFDPAGEEKLAKDPILEAVHLKKDFPLRL